MRKLLCIKFIIVLGLVLSFMLGLSKAAIAECSPENWQDCKDKPWVVGDKMETPLGEKWWPNKLWGADDQAGSTNWYTKPDVVLRALAEANKGKVYKLGREYDSDIPMFGGRKFVLRMPGMPTGGPYGANTIVYNDEFLVSEIGQVGTQFDGLGHVGVGMGGPGNTDKMLFYNGFTGTEIYAPQGLKKLGPEKLYPIIARGILLDIAAAKGVEMLEGGYVINMSDVEAALTKQGMANYKFMPGDGVFFHTGWGKLWKKDNAKFAAKEPGIGMEIAKWLSDDVQAGVTGADSWGTEAVPGEDPVCAFCVHNHLLTRHGIVNQENMMFDDLIRNGVYTFMYIYSPMPIVGATGSPGAPVAID